MLEGVDPERYDEVLDLYDEQLTTLKRLIKANPTAKHWRKLSAHLEKFPMNADFEEVIVPWIDQFFGKWERNKSLGIGLPKKWMTLLKDGAFCPGLGIFKTQLWHDQVLPGLLVNQAAVARAKSLTLKGNLEGNIISWAPLLNGEAFEHLRILELINTPPGQDPVDWLDAFDAPNLKVLRFKNLRIELDQFESLLQSPLCQRCEELDLVNAGLDDLMGELLLNAHQDNMLSSLRGLGINHNRDLSTDMQTRLFEHFGQTMLGMSSYGEQRAYLSSYFVGSVYTRHYSDYNSAYFPDIMPQEEDDDDSSWAEEWDYDDGWE